MYREAESEHHLEQNYKCEICGSPSYRDQSGTTYLIVCPCCGKYRCNHFSLVGLNAMKKEFPHLAYRISHSLRTIAEQAIANPDNSLFPIYDDEDFRGMLAQRDLPVQEKLNLLLRYLGNLERLCRTKKKCSTLCTIIQFCRLRNSREADFYINSLKERSLIRAERIMPDSRISFALTTNGWIFLESA